MRCYPQMIDQTIGWGGGGSERGGRSTAMLGCRGSSHMNLSLPSLEMKNQGVLTSVSRNGTWALTSPATLLRQCPPGFLPPPSPPPPPYYLLPFSCSLFLSLALPPTCTACSQTAWPCLLSLGLDLTPPLSFLPSFLSLTPLPPCCCRILTSPSPPLPLPARSGGGGREGVVVLCPQIIHSTADQQQQQQGERRILAVMPPPNYNSPCALSRSRSLTRSRSLSLTWI